MKLRYNYILHTILRKIIKYEAGTLILRKTEERWLIVLERKIVGPTKDKETAEWRVIKNKELEKLFQISIITPHYSLYSNMRLHITPNITK